MADSYQQVFDSLGGIYDPQVNQVNSQIAQLAPQQAAQQAGLDQAKVNAFKDITNQSNSRGVLFSGIPIDQQATYTGTKYLPAVANLQTSFNNTKNTLLGQINTLQGNRQREAQQTVAAQQKAEADAAYRNAQLGLSYARLAKSGGSGAAKAITQQQAVSGINQGLQSVRGRDGYVSPQDYAKAYKDWVTAGFSGNTFNNQFKTYRNPKNSYYDYAIRTG